MAQHTISDTNPLRVTGADNYRITFTRILTPEHRRFAEMEEFFLPEHRRPEGYGLAFLESEEHSLTYVGPIEQIEQFRRDAAEGPAVLDGSRGVAYEFWPAGPGGWDEFLPPNTWNDGGEGIVCEFNHPHGGKVVVYEYLADYDGERVPRVAMHCGRCHPTEVNWDFVFNNRGPHSRRAAARKAREHVHRPDRECEPPPEWLDDAAAMLASKIYDRDVPVVSAASRCATRGPCSQIRLLRAKAARSS